MDGRTATDASSEPAYAGFTDETQYNVGRYRGVALVGAPLAQVPLLSGEVERILAESGVAECKWEKVRSARTRFAAEKLLVWALDAALADRLHVDTLTWDAGELPAVSRSGTRPQPLPYLKRLHQMYAALLAEALAHRWPDGRAWVIFPDEQNALRWPVIAAASPRIASVEPRVSGAEPLIQLADLFAGLAVFSRAGYDTYERWLCLRPAERIRATEPSAALRGMSASDRQRCLLLDAFFTLCKLRLPGVSLRTQRGLRTYDPEKPITFHWHTDGV